MEVVTAGRTDLEAFIEKSGLVDITCTLKHNPFLAFMANGDKVEVRIVSKPAELLDMADDTKLMAQWPGHWSSDFFQMTVGDLRPALARQRQEQDTQYIRRFAEETDRVLRQSFDPQRIRRINEILAKQGLRKYMLAEDGEGGAVMGQDKPKGSYVGRKECGCVAMVAADYGDRKSLAQSVTEAVRAGLTVTWVPWSQVPGVLHEPTFFKCPHGQQQLPGMEGDDGRQDGAS